MKQLRIEDRWVARAEDGGPEARAGTLLRQAAQREPLEARRLDAIRARLRRARRRPQRHWMLRFAISLALVASGGALTAAAQRYLHWPAPAEPAPPPRSVPTAAQSPARTRSPVLPAPPVPPEPAPLDERMPLNEVPPTSAAPAARPGAARRPAPLERDGPVTPPPLVPAAGAPSALAEESALLAEALRKLRQGDDAPAALAILDAHEQRFPAGALAPEATLTRIEALLKTRRNTDALSLLDRATPVARGRGRDLLVARAELRATAGRRAAASADFDRLLAGDPVSDSITERATWGRAACRAADGDAAGARRDLQDYLGRFPQGRFADDARAALRP